MDIMNTYNVTEFANLIGVSVKTLQRWDRDERLVAFRTPTNRRMYTDKHLIQFVGEMKPQTIRRTIVYARVSSQSQKPDLENQIKVLESFCAGSGFTVDEWVKEIGGGLNFKRKKFIKLIDRIILGQVERLVIAHKDRLTRFGYDLIVHLCKIHDCELVVMNNESLSPEQDTN